MVLRSWDKRDIRGLAWRQMSKHCPGSHSSIWQLALFLLCSAEAPLVEHSGHSGRSEANRDAFRAHC
jgi:hypothetical protein